jgi:methylated-DNA-protein-cysteine methyltransferase-like protein
MDIDTSKVRRIIDMIPTGRVMSYGQIAAYLGMPKAARDVGRVMRDIGSDAAWWRVLNNAGEISIGGNPDASAAMQKSLLEKECIEVSPDLKLDIDRYRFRLNEDNLRELGLSEDEIVTVIKKFQEPRQMTLF